MILIIFFVAEFSPKLELSADGIYYNPSLFVFEAGYSSKVELSFDDFSFPLLLVNGYSPDRNYSKKKLILVYFLFFIFFIRNFSCWIFSKSCTFFGIFSSSLLIDWFPKLTLVNKIGFLSLSNEVFNPWSDFNEGFPSNFESSSGGKDFSVIFFIWRWIYGLLFY